MLPKNRPPSSTGEMLQHFLEEYGLTQTALAQHLEWTHTKINQLVKNKRAITPETALSLADAFGNSPEFWLNGQRNWDLWHALQQHEQKPRLETLAG
jgi:addiction module HigA family antidote